MPYPLFQIIGSLFLSQLLVTTVFGGATEEIQDSIRLDGEILMVDARVRFDSAHFQGFLHNQDQATKNNFFGDGFMENKLAFALPEASNSGNGVGAWSHKPSVSWAMAFGLRSAISKGMNRSKERRIEWSCEVERINRPTLDLSYLPDSLIGFLPADKDQSIQGVVLEEFSIGIETDTIPIALMHRTNWRTSFRLGLAQSWKNFGFLHAGIGATILLATEERIGLYTPDESRESAYSVRSLSAGSVFPFMDLGITRRLGDTAVLHSSFWSLGMNMRIQPGLSTLGWLGAHVRYNWK